MTEAINQDPSRNTANDDELAGLFLEVLDKFLAGVDDMLPAIVEQYDPASNRATVKPLIQKLGTNNSLTSRANLASVPVFQMGAGGYLINVKPKKGDLGWIKASDRDISLFLQSYEEAKPNTLRKHDFGDSVFFPDAMRGYTASEDDGLSIQNTAGTIKIALQVDKVLVTGASEFIGDVKVTGNIEASGEVTANALLAATKVTLSGHAHITTSPGDPTSPPIIPEV